MVPRGPSLHPLPPRFVYDADPDTRKLATLEVGCEYCKVVVGRWVWERACHWHATWGGGGNKNKGCPRPCPRPGGAAQLDHPTASENGGFKCKLQVCMRFGRTELQVSAHVMAADGAKEPVTARVRFATAS